MASGIGERRPPAATARGGKRRSAPKAVPFPNRAGELGRANVRNGGKRTLHYAVTALRIAHGTRTSASTMFMP